MDKLFTVEVSEDLVEIHLNNDGIDLLIDRLNFLKKSNKNVHAHLMTTEWGGNELTNVKQNSDEKFMLFNHLKLIYWK